ncbi:hypothetical protein O181_052006 [Austropuccinia psidii MF-1]|uniref:Uncharacterized protein n=1 Tax=Austropuccinia psidii MF-1 TaxID=1389203 RepID=A0A9Q3HNV8_9BASI|nr:hypothetical protein [Austropuccinia psidii MF-1]
MKLKKKRINKAATTNVKRPQLMVNEEAFKRAPSERSTSASEEDVTLKGGVAGGFCTKEQIIQFQGLMKEMIMPSGSTKLPFNLGAAKHGRLKAAQWLSLFTLVIPNIIPEMFINHPTIDMKSNQVKFLQNKGNLVQFTRIGFAKMIREGHAGRFYHAYKRYTDSSKALLNNPKIKPNNHYALHIPEQIKLWGPLMGVAEFSGERTIGLLQNIQTNHKIGELAINS